MNYGHPIMLYGDAISVGAILGSWLGYLPDLAAGASFVWFTLQIVWAIADRRDRRRRLRDADE